MRRLAPRLAERGATLVVVLIMLVILTLFAISAVNLTSANLKVIGNMQARKAADAAAQYALEQTLSSMSGFTSYATPLTVTAPNGIAATVQPRTCLYATAATGYSAIQPIVPEDTNWEIRVDVTDAATGATARTFQGAKIRMLAGGCP